MVVEAAPKDTGHLRQSICARQDFITRAVEIVLDAPHAAIVELGARPHMAPIEPLIDWVHRHADAFGAATPEDEMRIARAVQHKIAEAGTEPTFFVRDSLPALVNLLSQAVTREMART